MMEYNPAQAIAILSCAPATLRALLTGLDDQWIHARPHPDAFSAFDVIGHLIHGEQTDWIPRARHILEHGTNKPFEPFDRFAQREISEGKTLAELLDTFERLRGENVEALRQLPLTEENLDRQGIHPEFGTVTLRQHLSTWVVHDLNHIMQIVRTMAAEYTENVGPWRRYLSILHPRG